MRSQNEYSQVISQSGAITATDSAIDLHSR